MSRSIIIELEKEQKNAMIQNIANIIKKLRNHYSSWKTVVSSGNKRIMYIPMLDKIIPEEKSKEKQ